ncbi:hypothetical protein ARMSODRAFT_89994 [Armillaria solidipes]|uniref:Uncharacterized protein n=1 Tax=Armillaria solidipes TaxID=1076256 RepID=A0A2H3BIP5_9AGAR|nr:hypothetical protein ARMSODRAFT_89994 [Armillaria solidipes]
MHTAFFSPFLNITLLPPPSLTLLLPPSWRRNEFSSRHRATETSIQSMIHKDRIHVPPETGSNICASFESWK